jgi:ligand-binding sensor domain-containing protein
VTYDPNTGTAQWRNLSSGLGDQPILSVAYDADARRLYAATDFGVLVRTGEGAWMQAAGGLPPVAVYQLVLDQGSHLLYAATHGRGIYRLERSED